MGSRQGVKEILISIVYLLITGTILSAGAFLVVWPVYLFKQTVCEREGLAKNAKVEYELYLGCKIEIAPGVWVLLEEP